MSISVYLISTRQGVPVSHDEIHPGRACLELLDAFHNTRAGLLKPNPTEPEGSFEVLDVHAFAKEFPEWCRRGQDECPVSTVDLDAMTRQANHRWFFLFK